MVAKINLSWREIERLSNKLAIDILKSDFKPEYIVGISRGGLTPAVIISHILDVPMYTLKVTLRDGQEEDCDHNCWMSEDAFGYGSAGCLENEPTRILIVDDINDTGATFNWIKQDWRDMCLPNSADWQNIWHENVRFAVLVDNVASEFKTDYSAMEINKAEDPSWIVFPWETK